MTQPFSKMNKLELIEYCRSLYSSGGIEALSYTALSKQGALYTNLYRHGLKQKELVAQLGLHDQYQAYKKSTPIVRKDGRLVERWTWERILQEAKSVKAQHGHLPPAAWFQSNGYGSLVQAVYYLDRTWEALREEVGDFEGSSFVESRNGLRWRSHPEAALSNFLYARGVEHKRGERYPADFAKRSTSKYAYFDMHFLARNQVWIDVEIWGDRPNGHDEVRYKEKRQHKENFNQQNPNFLGIHFKDCFGEKVLTRILDFYIGTIEPFRFDKSTDPLIHSTHWSNTDELLDHCRQLAASMPNGEFPTEEWLRKRGKWANRPGEVYNTLSIYIKTWLGGVRTLRRLLDQSHVSTAVWDKPSAIEAYRRFFEEHGITPDQARHVRRKKSLALSKEVVDQAARISSAALKYAGGSTLVNNELGISIDRTRRWTRESILKEFRKIIEEWGVSPGQLLGDHRSGNLELSADNLSARRSTCGCYWATVQRSTRSIQDTGFHASFPTKGAKVSEHRTNHRT